MNNENIYEKTQREKREWLEKQQFAIYYYLYTENKPMEKVCIEVLRFHGWREFTYAHPVIGVELKYHAMKPDENNFCIRYAKGLIINYKIWDQYLFSRHIANDYADSLQLTKAQQKRMDISDNKSKVINTIDLPFGLLYVLQFSDESGYYLALDGSNNHSWISQSVFDTEPNIQTIWYTLQTEGESNRQ
jgi:hypothetical protein